MLPISINCCQLNMAKVNRIWLDVISYSLFARAHNKVAIGKRFMQSGTAELS